MRASWPAPLLHYRAMPFEGDATPLRQPTLYLIDDRDGCVMVEAGAGQERFFTGPFSGPRSSRGQDTSCTSKSRMP